MFKKIRNFLISCLYGFFHGLKKGENEMLLSKNSSHTDSIIEEQVSENNLGENLLEGEVTQEVKDLRYSTYKVYKESKKYDYVENGIVQKKKDVSNKEKISFCQNNKYSCQGVYDALFGDNNDIETYTLNIGYNYISKFRVERFIESFQVIIENGICYITFRFNYDYNLSNPLTKMFFNELKSLTDNNIKNNTISENINSVGFTTYKAQGEDDFIVYIINNLHFEKCEQFETYVLVTFSSVNFQRTDLTDKFFSSNQEQRYAKQEERKQKNNLIISHDFKRFICSECGKEMNRYDYEVTKYDFGKSLCVKCLEKYLTNIKE